MRCHICDQALSETEIKFNRPCDEWEPCGTCLTVISEVFEDYVPEDEVIEIEEENTDVDFLLDKE